ncbi:transposase [Arthrobacter sp. CAN_A1]
MHRWLKIADREDGLNSEAVSDDSVKLREANKRIRLLEQEAEVMRRAVAYLSRDINPKK